MNPALTAEAPPLDATYEELALDNAYLHALLSSAQGRAELEKERRYAAQGELAEVTAERDRLRRRVRNYRHAVKGYERAIAYLKASLFSEGWGG